MNDSVASDGLGTSNIHPDYEKYSQFLKGFSSTKSDCGRSHIWLEEVRFRERMNEIEKALFGAGAKL